MYSNELKAAKRRIYRQRQKTEEQRQILRYVLASVELVVVLSLSIQWQYDSYVKLICLLLQCV
jgi:hypothetical protein